MAHPKETKRLNGKFWHLEDKELTLTDARALRNHLRFTEDKKARIVKKSEGYEVWWSK